MRRFLLLLLPVAFLACNGGKDTAGDEADTDTDTDADTDTDTDSDADTDTDTDTDTQVQDGEFRLNLAADVGGTIVEDVCPGTISISNDGKGNLSGSASCEFQGTFAAFLSGEQVADVVGTTDGSTASGSLVLDISGEKLQIEWAGPDTSGSVNGAFEGKGTFAVGANKVAADYEGEFIATY